MKKIAGFALALAMAATISAVPMFAAETEQTTGKTANQVWNVDNNLNEASSKMTLEILNAEDILVATVPLELPVVMDTRGNITVPTNTKIINNSDKEIKVTKLTMTLPAGNSIAKETKVISKFNETARLWYYTINGEIAPLGAYLGTTGNLTNGGNNEYFSLTEGKWNIKANAELPLNLQLQTTKKVYESAMEKQDYGTLTFTIAYAE